MTVKIEMQWHRVDGKQRVHVDPSETYLVMFCDGSSGQFSGQRLRDMLTARYGIGSPAAFARVSLPKFKTREEEIAELADILAKPGRTGFRVEKGEAIVSLVFAGRLDDQAPFLVLEALDVLLAAWRRKREIEADLVEGDGDDH